MKPILLHIGSTKTGTSSLQQYCKLNAENLASQGVSYPIAGRNVGSKIAHHNLCYEKQKGRVANGVFHPEGGVWSEALAEIEDSSASVGVISSEAFMNCRPHQVQSFARVLDGRYVRVIAYVRRQDLWLQSAWNQKARFGRSGFDFWDFYESVSKRGGGDYHRTLKPWAEAFGVRRIFVRNFDALPPGGIVPDFLGTFLPDVKVVEPDTEKARRNTKAGIKQLVAVATVLDICRDRVGPEFALATSSAIKIAQYFRDRPDEITDFSVLSYEDACELHRQFAESNELLAELSQSFSESGGFAAPKPDDYRNYINLNSLGEEVFSEDERRFVTRMAREVTRVAKKNSGGTGAH